MRVAGQLNELKDCCELKLLQRADLGFNCVQIEPIKRGRANSRS